MKNFLIGLILGWIVVGLGAIIFIKAGGFPVPAKSKPLPFEETIADISLKHAMRGSENLKPTVESSEPHLIEGAKIYKSNCAFCHSLPGKSEPSFAAKGMFPGPPMLFQRDQDVSEMPVGTTFWIIKNGIRLTGMPGFEDTLPEEKLWEVTWLLKMSNELPPAVKSELSAPAPQR